MSNERMICVKRPEPGLSELFEDMYVNERLVDVTLSCADGQLQAHRLVLAACSPYFSNLFNKLSNPFHYPVIVIKDMQIEDLKMIVDYMYRGQIVVSQDRLASLVKSAENLQITGLTSYDKLISSPADGSTNGLQMKLSGQRYKRAKRTFSSASNNNSNNQPNYPRAYQQNRCLDTDNASSPRPDKLLEQSMVTGESLDGNSNHQLNYSLSNDPTSTRNLINGQQLTPASSMQLQHLGLDLQQQQQHHQQHLNNQLQVLSHSTSANRTSMGHSSSNGQSSNQLTQQQTRGRVHPCNICWKTFREKANLKRHLQVHSIDRVIYACPDCNKTFSWKDNYIRHTKTAHHMNNMRSQA